MEEASMYVTNNDLLKLPYLNKCKVLTGDIGLNNIISWPYVAKTLLLENLFRGGEFVIIAETYVPFSEEILLNFLDIGKACNISGILIFLDKEREGKMHKVPQSVINKAISYQIPIFEMPWEIRSIDVLKSISFLIFENEHRHNGLDECMKNIIFFDGQLDTISLRQLQNYNYDDQPYFLFRLQLFDFTDYCENRGITGSVSIHNQKKFIKHSIISFITTYFPNVLICDNSDIIAAIIPSSLKDRIFDGKTINSLKKDIQTTIPNLTFCICVSQQYDTIKLVNEAFHQTTHLLPLRQLDEFRDVPILYDRIGLYKVLIQLNRDALTSIYQSTFAQLIEADNLNQGELIETLQVYLKNNMSVDATARELFIHNNTIRYRLKKIESYTGMSLKSVSDLTMLYYCICVLEYLNLKE